jgi:hypothetical protein
MKKLSILIASIALATINPICAQEEPQLTEKEARSYRYKTQRLNIKLDSYLEPRVEEYASIFALMEEIVDTEVQHHIMFPEKLKSRMHKQLGEKPSLSTVMGLLGLSCGYTHTSALTQAHLKVATTTKQELMEARDNAKFVIAAGTRKKDEISPDIMQEHTAAMQRCVEFYNFVEQILTSKKM